MPDSAAGEGRRGLYRIVLVVAALGLLAGYLLYESRSSRPVSLTSSAPAASTAAPPPPRSAAPLTDMAGELPLPRTTDPDTAIHNLEVQIQSTEVELERAPLDPSWRGMLVSFLMTHGDFVGILADYDKAEAIAEEGVKNEPKRQESYRTRARVRSLFHRFDEASADLDEAESLGAKKDELVDARASILIARGKLDEALALLEPRLAPPTSQKLASLGLLYLEVGHEKEGTEMLEQSRKMVRDVAPFPRAWLDYQEAEIRERHGQDAQAKQLYIRAHRLVPTYAVAAAHLAPFLGAEDAVDMLEKVAERSDDPEVLSVLAGLLEKAGRKAEAQRDIETAARRYDDLVARHEAAFADHAARFWLGVGKKPEKAFELAKKNLLVRQTSQAYDLALTAALVTKHDAEACDLAARALALKYPDEALKTVATSTRASRCGDAVAHGQ